MSVFAQDPELADLPMGIDNNEPVYLTPEPKLPAPNFIPDDMDTNFKAGRMLEQDTPNISETIEPISDERDDDESDTKKQGLAVKKSIEKGARLEREMRRLDTSYNPIRNQTMTQQLTTFRDSLHSQPVLFYWDSLDSIESFDASVFDT
jgi:hypothetical protein